MCSGFGLVIDREYRAYFSEPDTSMDCSHSTTIKRLGWKDNKNQHLRHFVRVQCPDWTIASFEFDEEKTLPGWVDEQRVINLTEKLLEKVAPLDEEYRRIQQQAWAAMVASMAKIEGYVPQKNEPEPA